MSSAKVSKRPMTAGRAKKIAKNSYNPCHPGSDLVIPDFLDYHDKFARGKWCIYRILLPKRTDI